MKPFTMMLAASLLLAGCGANGMMGQPAPESALMGQSDVNIQALDASGSARMGMPGHRMGAPMFGMMARHLGLSADQQKAAQAIVARYRSQLAPASLQARHDQFKALLLADSVDGAALKAMLVAGQDEMAAHVDGFVAMLGELRGVLSDAQRATIASRAGAMGHGMMAGMGGAPGPFPLRALQGLNLTADQSAALDALKAKIAANRAQHDPQAMRAAFQAFATTGDQAAFKAALVSFKPAAPIDELVHLATLLDLKQRQALMERLTRSGAPRPMRF